MSTDSGGPIFPHELAEQPRAIRASLAATETERQRVAQLNNTVSRVILVGSGDSVFLGHAAVVAFERVAQLPAEAIEAYDLVSARATLLGPGTLVIGISASGKAVRTLQAIEVAQRASAPTVAITNIAANALGQRADVTLVTGAGMSYSFPTKTTTSALAVAIALAADLGLARGVLSAERYADTLDELGDTVPAAIGAVIQQSDTITAASQVLPGRRQLIVVGSGAAYATALIGAAKLIETSHRHTVPVNAETFLHLIGFATTADDAVIVVATQASHERERQVAEYAARLGAAVVVVRPDDMAEGWPVGSVQLALPIANLSPWASALVAMVPLQLLAFGLSQLLASNPDRPEGADLEYVLRLLYSTPLEGWV